MKQFFEQYGTVALGILALLVLIAMITPVGNIIKTSLQGTTSKFSTEINAQTDTMTMQMQQAFDSATEYVYIANDGKAYIKDKLYTGWSGDKAYLNGEEQFVRFDAFTHPVFMIRPDNVVTGIATILSYKIDDNIIINGNVHNPANNLRVAPGVSKYEMIIKYPSIYELRFENGYNLSDWHLENISEEDDYCIAKLTGTLARVQENGDIFADDFGLTLK